MPHEYVYAFLSRHPIGITIGASLANFVAWLESFTGFVKVFTVYLSFLVLLLTAIVKLIDTYDKVKARFDVEAKVETDIDQKEE
ncbi:hypothetical protein [Salinibacter phage M8CRM-1]|uniref:Uncharacterized protein n=1 Tax=Salinibacter phage M8CRM-1 TaxID=2681612 RepID=A0A2I6UGS4_9CAUD|nr:hypothetical protein FGG67_gp31 [Salinibacter phage M8CRM-1]AUO79170.1 hypothetical protein [Salinibacter phage M8CRM-1]